MFSMKKNTHYNTAESFDYMPLLETRRHNIQEKIVSK